MQGSSEESKVTSSPSLAAEFSQQFNCKMKLHDLGFSQMEKAPLYGEEVQLDGEEEEEDEEEEEEEEEEEFTFACVGSDELPISADDAFRDGQVKPTFPLFDQSLVFGADLAPAREDLARRPQVKKVFIEADESPSTRTAEEEIEDLERENPAGLYCTWSRKAVEASPEICKKSNSTGFSKIWRLRELTNRSNSDGRDAFVFLNNNNNNNGKTTTYSKREEKREGEVQATSETTTFSKREEKVIKAKKGKKGETTSLSSAHELHYARNRALREGDRRRSYLPYKPGLVGFFTNVNGGLSRNVHPF